MPRMTFRILLTDSVVLTQLVGPWLWTRDRTYVPAVFRIIPNQFLLLAPFLCNPACGRVL